MKYGAQLFCWDLKILFEAAAALPNFQQQASNRIDPLPLPVTTVPAKKYPFVSFIL